MRKYALAAVALTAGLLLATLAPAQDLDETALRRRELAQERAQALARDLVASILDIQLRQFEENGLAKMPVYLEIKTMRDNVDALVGAEMQAVVDLLVKAQKGDQASRLRHFNAARDQIREVVLALMAERQRLYRRLQVAKLAAQVRELIEIETVAQTRTVGLLDQPTQQREAIALRLIQDQRDVASLFVRLVNDLAEVTQWGGKVGAGAADGVRILKAARTSEHLDSADQNLSTGQYAAAGQNQAEVIQGLRRLLEKLEETRGLISGDRDAARKLIEEIIEKQAALRQTTKETDLSKLTPDALTEAQEEIRNDLGKLAQQLEEIAPLQPLLEQSKAAAHDAVAELFEGDQDAALADQSAVLGALAELSNQLDSAAAQNDADKSADQLAAEVAKLEELQEKLNAVAEKQTSAEAAVERDVSSAQAVEAGIAEELAQLADQAAPSPVETRLLDAQDAAVAAAEALQAAHSQKDLTLPQSARDAMRQATDAIETAQAETAAQLADMRRKRLAVQVGELARGAEALERAAAAERDLAAEAEAAALRPAAESKPAAAELVQTQKQVEKVANEISAGLRQTAPQVSETLSKLRPELAKATQSLSGAAEREDARPTLLQSAATAAQSAAETLKQAAAELRKQAGQSAQELTQLTDRQLAQTTDVKEAVTSTLDKAATPDRLEQLRSAQQKIAAAQLEQLKASGKPAAATARQLADEIEKAAQMQNQANAAANELNQGKANSSVDAAAKQQQTADQAESLAQQTGGAIAEALKNAKRAAATAAQETLSGDPNKAAAAREEAAAQLASALRKAQQKAKESQADPAGQPDPMSQTDAAQLAADAAQLAESVNPAAAAAAQQAATAGEKAAQQLAQGDAQAASQSQRQADQALTDASQKLAEAVKRASQQLADDFAKQAPQVDQLARQARGVDPNAASALRQASEASQAGADAGPSPQDPNASAASGEMRQAADDALRTLRQAAAALTARQQQLARDKSIAEALAAIAERQQAAREQIDRQAEALAQNSPQPTDPGQTPAPAAPAAKQAAQKLADASQQFAAAQTAAGQGAQQISGQQEVANLPLRSGLEAASQLPQPEQSLAPTPPASELAVGDTGPEVNSSGQSPGGEGNQPSSNPQPLGQAGQSDGPGQTAAADSASQTLPGDGQDLGMTS
ncbi:MAG: hypothetical protein ACIALR_13265, partial [Blastopirellula sp. JB062]